MRHVSPKHNCGCIYCRRLSGGLPAATHASENFPPRPITLIVPFAPDVTADLLFRGIAEVASKHLGQPAAIENRAGGSATLGPSQMAENSKPDGYTIAQIAIPMLRVPVI
jgi:tripartite-type tricarboxylate transporter receptor subunit TctC